MAISQRTRTVGTAASGVGFTVGFPTGVATGDLLILVVANAGTAAPAAPTGWTRFYSASAGSGQNVAVFSAPWSAGLTTSFTNAASAAAWACNAFLSSDTGEQVDVDAFTATTNTTNNTTLPTGAPTSGGVAGDYEVLCYGWTSAATITTTASGSTIDGTQANASAVSAAIGHNNTTSLGAATTPTAFSHTLSASNTRKTGVGVLLRETRNLLHAATPVTASIAETRRRARVSWVEFFTPVATTTFTRTATPVTAALSTGAQTRTATPVTAALSLLNVARPATPVTVALSSSGLRRTATTVSAALAVTATRSATPVTAALASVGFGRNATPVTVALSSRPTRTASPVTAAVTSGAAVARHARVSWVDLQLPDPAAPNIRVASPLTVALRAPVTRTATPVTVSLSGAIPFISAASANGRYMLDQFGQPIFLQGDSPQTMLSHFSTADMATFFSGQSSRGYNCSQIHLILSDLNAMAGNSGGLDANGNAPFTNMAALSGPVPAYWNNVDQMLTLAEQNGITVFCGSPDNPSMGPTIEGMTLTQCNTLGQFLGNRYKTRPNIVWLFGNDYQPSHYAARDAKYREILVGIRATGDTHMVTTWLDTEGSSWDLATWDTLHALVLDYAYTAPYYQSELAWLDTSPGSPQPNFFGEGNYENEHLNSWSGISITTNETLRRTAWWPVTWGACGQVFGQRDVWRGNPTWTTAVTTQAAQENWRVASLLRSLAWWTLQPDFSHTLITSGFGTRSTDEQTDPLANDFATAAVSTDRHLAVIYVPTVRSWVIETTALIGNVTGFWFDPTTGTRTTATAPWTIPASAHSDGTHDWVLVLQSSSRTASPVTVSLFTPRSRTATPVTVSLGATPSRLGSPVTVSLQGSSTRVSAPLTATVRSSDLQRQSTPLSAALVTTGTRVGSSVSAALSSVNLRRTATPVTAAVQTSFSRGALPISAALLTAGAIRTATPVSVSLSRVLTANPVSVSLLAGRTATSVTTSLSTVLLSRTASPVTVALTALGKTRTATGVAAALSLIDATRTATVVTVALQTTTLRTATSVTAALSGAATARLATPISAALVSQLLRTASALSVALRTTTTRVGGSVTVTLVRRRAASPVTASLSAAIGVRTAHPVNVSLEGAEGPPPTRSVTATGRSFGTSAGGRRTGLTVKEN